MTSSVADWIVPFCIGGISGAAATSVIQPIDTLKVQIQVVSEQLGKSKNKDLSIFSILSKVKKEKGLSALYRGLDSAILRQIFYASARIGAYETSLKYLENNLGRTSSSLEKIVLSMLSGAFGALVGTPFDVALIRRQASVSNNKNHYPNTLKAFTSIIKEDGPLGLWRGLNITICRVVCINLGQLAGKDIISDKLKRYDLGLQWHLNITAILASLLTAAISLPVDNIKVKLQKQDKLSMVYSGIRNCLVLSVRNEGLLRLWVGLPIYFIRGTPHSFILLKTQQHLNEMWFSGREV